MLNPTNTLITIAARDHLTPFTKGDERARAAGRKGVAVREANRAAMRADIGSQVAALRTLADHAQGLDIAGVCLGVVVQVLSRVSTGAVPVRHAGDAAELVRVLVDVARLVNGQPTSTAVVAHLSSAEARARLAELAELASDRLSPAVVAAADDQVPSPGALGDGIGDDQGSREPITDVEP
jgi:hypothetical protein